MAFKPPPRPVQRRLDSREIDTLATDFQAGRSPRTIAKALGIHHLAVTAHVEQLGNPRRAKERKMSTDDVLVAHRRPFRVTAAGICSRALTNVGT